MSKVREFAHATMIHGDQRVGAVKVVCGNCEGSEMKPRGSNRSTHAPEQESQRLRGLFERSGWQIGERPQDDRCPGCIRVKKAKAANAAGQNVVQFHAEPEPAPAAEMGKAEGRIIFAKIEECYGDNEYKPGWSDKAIATALNCPPEWVARVRQEFFGDAGVSPEVKALVGEVRAHLDQCRAFEAMVQDAAAQLAKIGGALGGLQNRAGELRQAGLALEHRVGQLVGDRKAS